MVVTMVMVTMVMMVVMLMVYHGTQVTSCSIAAATDHLTIQYNHVIWRRRHIGHDHVQSK